MEIYKNIEIISLAFGGAGVGRLPSGKTVFVKGACPGDVLNVRILEEKKTYTNACIEQIVSNLDFRVTPACSLAKNNCCGGCPWAHISYEQQLFWKTQAVIDAFVRIGHFEKEHIEALIQPIIASAKQFYYRNKIEFTCGYDVQNCASAIGIAKTLNQTSASAANMAQKTAIAQAQVQTQAQTQAQKAKFTLGMHEHGGAFHPIQNCLLIPEVFQEAPKALAGALRYVLKDDVKQLLRVGLRISENTGDVEVALWTKPERFSRAMAAQVIQDALGSLAQKHKSSKAHSKTAAPKKKIGVVRVITKNDPKKRKISKVEVLNGKGFWRERLAGNTLKLSAPSFFQVNTQAAEHLIELVLKMLSVEKTDTVADLYCGAGTFTLPLAQIACSVYAVEMEGSSVRDLRRNLQDNNLEATIIAGDVGRELQNLPYLDKIVLDPPRAGLGKKVISGIISKAPERIAYVSCNPTTLARDVATFEQCGYSLQSINPVDLFPQTYHVETVVLLCKV